MIRLFNVYYSTRTLVLLLCEALIVSGSFLLATVFLLGPDTYIALIYENGLLKIGVITVLALLLSYYFDLYEPQRISEHWEIYFRLLLVLSVLSFGLAGFVYFFPDLDIGPNVLAVGISILVVALVIWRRAYEWIIGLPEFSRTCIRPGLWRTGPHSNSIAALPARCGHGSCEHRPRRRLSRQLGRLCS